MSICKDVTVFAVAVALTAAAAHAQETATATAAMHNLDGQSVVIGRAHV